MAVTAHAFTMRNLAILLSFATLSCKPFDKRSSSKELPTVIPSVDPTASPDSEENTEFVSDDPGTCIAYGDMWQILSATARNSEQACLNPGGPSIGSIYGRRFFPRRNPEQFANLDGNLMPRRWLFNVVLRDIQVNHPDRGLFIFSVPDQSPLRQMRTTEGQVATSIVDLINAVNQGNINNGGVMITHVGIFRQVGGTWPRMTSLDNSDRVLTLEGFDGRSYGSVDGISRQQMGVSAKVILGVRSVRPAASTINLADDLAFYEVTPTFNSQFYEQ